eukprot:COSAG01_NODE_2644_length_7322_cov_10.222899_7_plen_185_part_01
MARPLSPITIQRHTGTAAPAAHGCSRRRSALRVWALRRVREVVRPDDVLEPPVCKHTMQRRSRALATPRRARSAALGRCVRVALVAGLIRWAPMRSNAQLRVRCPGAMTFSGSAAATLTGHSDWVLSLAYLSDKGVLASGSGDHTVKLWAVAADGRSASPAATLTGHSLAYLSDKGVLASGAGGS